MMNKKPETGIALKKRKLVCVNELSTLDTGKLEDVLKDTDMLYYF
jgi:hypothetical protein